LTKTTRDPEKSASPFQGRKSVKRAWDWQNEFESVLTIGEVAEILRVHPATIYRLVRRGELPGFKIGNTWRINRASLELWLLAEPPQHLTSRV
jgi:excisionase family DNA binding protein